MSAEQRRAKIVDAAARAIVAHGGRDRRAGARYEKAAAANPHAAVGVHRHPRACRVDAVNQTLERFVLEQP